MKLLGERAGRVIVDPELGARMEKIYQHVHQLGSWPALPQQPPELALATLAYLGVIKQCLVTGISWELTSYAQFNPTLEKLMLIETFSGQWDPPGVTC
jgi:hypothetical protein